MKDPAPLAFPSEFQHMDGSTEYQPGLTKREYFAAKMIAAFVSNPDVNFYDFSEIAHDSVAMADALIKALES